MCAFQHKTKAHPSTTVLGTGGTDVYFPILKLGRKCTLEPTGHLGWHSQRSHEHTFGSWQLAHLSLPRLQPVSISGGGKQRF